MDEGTGPVAALISRRTRLAIRLRTHPLRWIALISILSSLPWGVARLLDVAGAHFFVSFFGLLVISAAASFHLTPARSGLLERAGALVVVTMVPLVLVLIVLHLDRATDAAWIVQNADELSLYVVVPAAVSFCAGHGLRGGARERRSVPVDVVIACAAVAALFGSRVLGHGNDGLAWWALGWAVLGGTAFHRIVTGVHARRWLAPSLAALLGLMLASRVGTWAGDAAVGWVVVVVAAVPLYAVARLAGTLSVPPPDHPLRADHALEIGAVGTRGSRGTSGSESMSAREARPG